MGNQVIFSEGFGFLDAGEKNRTKSSSLFRVASISKIFTALGMMKLVEQGLVKLDDSVAQHLPWFRMSGRSEDWKKITIRHLLTLSSGISRELGCEFTTSDGEWIPLESLEPCVITQEQIFAPGTRLKYSNMGMIISGHVIAELVGDRALPPMDRFQRFMKAEVLAPLGMNDSSYTLDSNRMDSLAVPLGHIDAQSNQRVIYPKAATTYISAPACGLTTSARDLSKLNLFLYAVTNNLENGLISLELASSMIGQPTQDLWGDPSLYQGIGFFIKTVGASRLVGHTGHFPGYTAQDFFDSTSGIGITVLTNSTERSAAQDIFNLATKQFNNQGIALSKETKSEPSNMCSSVLHEQSEMVGTFRGWPGTIAISHSEGDIYADLGGRLWKLAPDGHTGTSFRLDTLGKPNYVAALGERIEFRRAADGTLSLVAFGAYECPKLK